MKRTLILGLTLFFCTAWSSSQSDDQSWCFNGGKHCLTPTILIPSSRTFFDQGEDKEGEFDGFSDGHLNLDLQVFGGDFYYQALPNVRLGYLNFGFGTTSGTEGAPAVMLTLGSFIEFNKLFRFEAGLAEILTAKEGIGKRDDTAFYIGIGLNSSLGEKLKELITQ